MCSYRRDIETCKKLKKREKIELKFSIKQKQVKVKFLLLFCKILSAQFQVDKLQFSIQEKV